MKALFYIEKQKKHNIIHLLGLKMKFRVDGFIKHKIKRKERNFDFGILSFNINTDTFNYGAALHSYAFQKYLDKLKISNVIINYYPKNVQLANHFNKLLDVYNEHGFLEFCFYIKFLTCLLIKKYKFLFFFKKHCVITKHRYEIDTLEQLKSINSFICETDVTWHKFFTGYDRGFFCDLPNMKNKPNIAYSIDFGSKEITDGKRKKLKDFAQNFKHISVRNVFKLDYFKEIISRNEVALTIDPVFLLDATDYEEIIKTPIKKDYVFVYNCKENNPQMVAMAKQYARENHKEIIIVDNYDKNISKFQNCRTSLYSIEEFLGYLKNCSCCFTNSYHGICFSIIFRKNFICFEREGNNDKILTLLELFNLYSQLYINGKPVSFNLNYDEIYSHLEFLKQQSIDFLNIAMCREDNYAKV